MATIEAVLLNGGAGRRMGGQKGLLRVQGEPMEERIARLLRESGYPVTVLGRPIHAAAVCLPDNQPLAGPLAALANFRPSRELVFLCACDLPAFEPEIVSWLALRIGTSDAVIPILRGQLQPLAALYRATSLATIPPLVASGERRIMAWVERLSYRTIPEDGLPRPERLRSANTPAEFERALREAGLDAGPPGAGHEVQ
jgi:molybdopterin-guanine dinucleotide biosynthesis protein A